MGAGVPLDGTSSIIVAIVLMTYVFMSIFTEQFFHYLHHYIKHHLHDSKEAYLNVLEKVKDEIMLVGVLTVVLLVVEERVAEDICITSIWPCFVIKVQSTHPSTKTSLFLSFRVAMFCLPFCSSAKPIAP